MWFHSVLNVTFVTHAPGGGEKVVLKNSDVFCLHILTDEVNYKNYEDDTADDLVDDDDFSILTQCVFGGKNACHNRMSHIFTVLTVIFSQQSNVCFQIVFQIELQSFCFKFAFTL